ncbi:MAG: DUF3644 domain-containing protein [Candidatus Limiplasma sp.]|nr:DUF3644 domain-containing protein [Candidatus Limiplasma sp.]
MEKKRKMVQSNLIKNAVAAYFAAVEIHNKPNISYRYETVTLLMVNAWELALKAYVRKYVKDRSIFEENGHSIPFKTAANYVNDHINSLNPKAFLAVKANLDAIEEYRNSIAHFYNEQLVPYIFMLISRCALNFVDFIKYYFQKDIMADDGLFILPLGFKLPFKPEDFLSRKAPAYLSTVEAKNFIDKVITFIEDLDKQGVEDSIVLGFEVYMQNVKKVQNSDLIVAITQSDNEADAIITNPKKVRLSSDPNAQAVYLSDEDFRKTFPYTHAELVQKCKEQIPDFKQDARYNKAKSDMQKLPDPDLYFRVRPLDPLNKNSASQKFYTELAIDFIRRFFREGEGNSIM